jgi:hypothetical protein
VGLVVVARLPTLVEAHIASGALRSAGFNAQVFDANFGGMEAPVIEGLGGYRVMTPESEGAAARETLRGLSSNPDLGEPEDSEPWARPAPSSRSFQARGMRVLALVLLGAPLLLWLLSLLKR